MNDTFGIVHNNAVELLTSSFSTTLVDRMTDEVNVLVLRQIYSVKIKLE